MNVYLVIFTLDEGGQEQKLRYRINAPSRGLAVIYAASIMGAQGNTPDVTVVTGVDTRWLTRRTS